MTFPCQSQVFENFIQLVLGSKKSERKRKIKKKINCGSLFEEGVRGLCKVNRRFPFFSGNLPLVLAPIINTLFRVLELAGGRFFINKATVLKQFPLYSSVLFYCNNFLTEWTFCLKLAFFPIVNTFETL